MSNAGVVRSLFDDFNRGDYEAAFQKIAEDVDWHEPPDMPDAGGGYRGHEGMVSGFGRFLSAWEHIRADLVQVVERGERVVVMTRWRGLSKGTGIEVDQWIAQIYELREGRVVRVRQFRTLEEALAAP
ncbi:MAG TPA: nuclear transport factor 2 family protein [Thermoleophilaceae bacterium]